VTHRRFQILALPREPFEALFGLPDAELAARGVLRQVADTFPGYPCRVSLQDAEVGETVLLLNHVHQPAATPYRGTHAIFVREHAQPARVAPGEVPEAIARRLLSVRAFDAAGLMRRADVVEGHEVAPLIDAWLDDPGIDELHLHHARQGCYAARVRRCAVPAR
jgi:hypothetical protein